MKFVIDFVIETSLNRNITESTNCVKLNVIYVNIYSNYYISTKPHLTFNGLYDFSKKNTFQLPKQQNSESKPSQNGIQTAGLKPKYKMKRIWQLKKGLQIA